MSILRSILVSLILVIAACGGGDPGSPPAGKPVLQPPSVSAPSPSPPDTLPQVYPWQPTELEAQLFSVARGAACESWRSTRATDSCPDTDPQVVLYRNFSMLDLWGGTLGSVSDKATIDCPAGSPYKPIGCINGMYYRKHILIVYLDKYAARWLTDYAQGIDYQAADFTCYYTPRFAARVYIHELHHSWGMRHGESMREQDNAAIGFFEAANGGWLNSLQPPCFFEKYGSEYAPESVLSTMTKYDKLRSSMSYQRY